MILKTKNIIDISKRICYHQNNSKTFVTVLASRHYYRNERTAMGDAGAQNGSVPPSEKQRRKGARKWDGRERCSGTRLFSQL